MNKTVIEYLEGYFDGQLNESISDDNIMEAFAELLETANSVEEYLNEQGLISKALGGMRNKKDLKKALMQRAHREAVGSIGSGHPWNADTPQFELSRRSLKRRGLKPGEPKRPGLPTYMDEAFPRKATDDMHHEAEHEAFPRKATDDIHHQAELKGKVNTDRSNLDKSIDANNLLMNRRGKRNKYLVRHTAAEDEARAARIAKISARTIRKPPKSERVMLRIPPGASTTPKPKMSLARQIRKLIKI